MDNEFVQALSTQDGKQVWATRLGKVGNPNQMPSFPAARSTPTVDGGLLYALGSDGDLACLETASGEDSVAEEPARRFRRRIPGSRPIPNRRWSMGTRWW